MRRVFGRLPREKGKGRSSSHSSCPSPLLLRKLPPSFGNRIQRRKLAFFFLLIIRQQRYERFLTWFGDSSEGRGEGRLEEASTEIEEDCSDEEKDGRVEQES